VPTPLLCADDLLPQLEHAPESVTVLDTDAGRVVARWEAIAHAAALAVDHEARRARPADLWAAVTLDYEV
jgi:hypothetical protein